MGTSSAYGGPGGGTPLVPTWLGPDGGGDGPAPTPPPDGEPAPAVLRPPVPPAPTDRPIPVPPALSQRFTQARSNFTRFAGSGGSDRASLGRAVSGYVSTASGGARTAAQRMGASRQAGANLLSFLADVQTRGAAAALRSLNLSDLAGRPIDEVFLGIADYVCPNVGSVDEGIAREAFIETIIELSTLGVTDLDALTPAQMQTVFEMYATHAIEARLCNDIGTKLITAPADAQTAALVQEQLRDFIRNGVSDAFSDAQSGQPPLTQDRVRGFVDDVYERAFSILKTLGDEEAEK